MNNLQGNTGRHHIHTAYVFARSISDKLAQFGILDNVPSEFTVEQKIVDERKFHRI